MATTIEVDGFTITLPDEPNDTLTAAECGCSILNGRCDTHAAMMREIHRVWNTSTDPAILETIWSMSDGYGEPGLVPPQGYDWSGIRDSTPDAVEAMHTAIHA